MACLLHVQDFCLPSPVIGNPKMCVLSDQTSYLFFISTEQKFVLQHNNELIQEREGFHYLFPTDTQVVVASIEDNNIRIAVYRMDNYHEPQKIKVKISKYLDMNLFKYQINFIDISSQRMLINIIRENHITLKRESVIFTHRIHEGFKVRYDKCIITSPKYFGEVCINTDKEIIDILGYRFIPYDGSVAIFRDLKIFIQDDKLIIRANEKQVIEKAIIGSIRDLEKMEKQDVCVTYLEIVQNRVFMKMLFIDGHFYNSYEQNEFYLNKYTKNDYIYLVSEHNIRIFKLENY